MTQTENLPHSPAPSGPDVRDRGIAIIVTPEDTEDVMLKKFPDGGYTIFLRGEIQIAIRPSRTKFQNLSQEKAMAEAMEASESPQRAGNGSGNGLVPETPSSKADAPFMGSEKVPESVSPTTPEQENQKFELTGNPVYDPKYRVRKSGKRLADFALATHDEHGGTKYWRVRAFDTLAERVRDSVRKGQTNVEAVVYGPKQWTQKKKTKEGGWTQETVSGYYAGMVRVPERYRKEETENA